MVLWPLVRAMSRKAPGATLRIQSIQRHMLSSAATSSEELVTFHSDLAVRKYTLNRPRKLNVLNSDMLDALQPKIEEWEASDLCKIIVATGTGRAFCAGGDVAAVVDAASDPARVADAVEFFRKEFQMDYTLAALRKPYIAIMDGITLGGGVGLAAPASFRVATENTTFGMPETKIGYCPDVGATYYLSRLDGQLGTYLGLTGNTVKGRSVYELGFATHYIESARIPKLLEALSSLDEATSASVDSTLEEFSTERQPEEPAFELAGDLRKAIDSAFRHNEVEKILTSLEKFVESGSPDISKWAQSTLDALALRSPTSLKVALHALRLGQSLSNVKNPLLESLNMELGIATAYCRGASSDFKTGVTEVVINKNSTTKPAWDPSSLNAVSSDIVSRFFNPKSPFRENAPVIRPRDRPSQKYNGLPTEVEIAAVVQGTAPTSGGKAVTYKDLIRVLQKSHGKKMGLEDKVTEVVSRKCEIVDNDDGNFVWLQWRS